jgi:hypothetical protein
VSVGEPLRRDIGRDGTIDVGADDVDMFKFDSPFTGKLTVRTDTSDEDSADTFLRVFDPAGNEIAFNNNASDSTTASVVTIDVTAGQTYYIGVNGASAGAKAYNALTGEGAVAGSQGHYTLTLEATESDLPLLSVNDTAATEVLGDDSSAAFTVTLSQASAGTVTVNYATADGSAAAGSDYVATSGTLTFAPGETSKTLGVDVVGDFDDEGAETFTLNLSGASGALLGDGQGTGTITNTTPTVTPMSFVPGQPATFTDAAGHTVTLSIKGPGSGTVFFASEGANAGRIVLDGTTSGTTFAMKGDTSVGDVVVNGSLKSLGSKTTDLTGHVTVSGAVPKVTFDDVTGATLSVGSGVVAITADQVSDLSVSSGAIIKSMKIGQWLDTDTTADTIMAPAVGAVAVKGAMQAGISAGTIGKVTVAGALSDAEISASDTIASVTAGSMAHAAILAGVSGAPLPAAAGDFTNPAGVIGAVTVKSKAAGSFSDTIIASDNVGKLSLSTVVTGNAGRTFGVAAQAIKSIAALPDAGGPIRLHNLLTAADSQAAGDFVVRLL